MMMWRDPGQPTDSYYEVRPDITYAPKTKFRIKLMSRFSICWISEVMLQQTRVATPFTIFLLLLLSHGKSNNKSTCVCIWCLPEDQAQLASWFRRVLITKESIRKAIDPNRDCDIVETFESICKVDELSWHCTA
ncbi:uncharacterized protein [Spinacia oleracea]|uniref:Uncharacterized protein n=1 Tax=Spinacia oleracea TaxID=3562 RepID=A0ABM3RU61_SPIOL|nr:uncharacterized protein LOC110782964 [Spinacia oleracea]